MISIDQLMRGAARFADLEIIPRLPTWKGVGIGTAITLMMDGGKARILQLREHLVVQLMGIMDEQGNVDLDRLYSAARPRVDGQKLPVPIPIIGELRFDVNDLDKLYKYIQEA